MPPHPRWLLPLVLGLQLLVFLPGLVQPGIIRAPLPKLSEATNQTYPWAMLWRDEIRAGRPPFWNPYIFGGTPLIGDPQTQTFYPAKAIWLVLPPDLAYKMSLLLHIMLGSWLMYRLLRELGANRLGASVSALAFGLHGQMIVFAYSGWIQMIAPMAWAPGVIWCLCRALRTDGRKQGGQIAIAALMLGMQIVSGHPEWVRYTLAIAAIVTIGSSSLRRMLIARVMVGMSVILLGVTIGAVQLLPLAQGVANSGRGQGALVGGAALHGTGLPPLSLPTILAPSLFGPWDLSLTTDGLVHKLSGSPISFGETLIYIGALPLLLALCSRRRDLRSGTAVWWTVAGSGLLFALNDWTHAQDLFDRIVRFDSAFRSPGRFVFLTNFALIVLAGAGASAATTHALRARLVAKWAAALAALIGVGAIAGWLFRSPIVALGLSRLHLPADTAQGVLAQQETIARLGGWAFGHALVALATAALLFALSAMTMVWIARGATVARQAAMLAVVALDLGWFAHPFLSSVVTIDAVYAHDRAMLAPVIGHPEARIGYTDPSIFEAGENAPIALRVRSMGGYESFHLASWDDWYQQLQRRAPSTSSWLQRAGVTHLLTRDANGTSTLTPAGGDAARAWWTDGVRTDHSDADVVVILRGITRSSEGVVVPPVPGGRIIHLDHVYPPDETGLAIDEDVPGHIHLHLNAKRAGWVVVTEASYPGWEARVNGRGAAIHTAFGIFQALEVPAGAVRVDLSFTPSVVTMAGMLSAMFAGLALMMMLTMRRSA